MSEIRHLDVIENDYQIVDWYIEPAKGYGSVFSDIRKFPGMNELRDYEESGVYTKAGVPFTIKRIDPYRYPQKEPYLAFAGDYSDKVCKSVKDDHIFLAAGSYCTNVPSILGGLRRAVGPDKKIGVIWMDAHADNHIVEDTRETKIRLLGVPMSTFLGQTFPQWRAECGLNPPIAGDDVIAGDIRYESFESSRNLEKARVNVIHHDEFNCPEIWKKSVDDLSARVDVLYLHVDADILHHSYVPAYEYDVVNGNSLSLVRQNIRCAASTGKLIGASVMCIGFENKDDRLRDVNNMNGIRLVSTLLSSWKEKPDL